VAKLFFLISGEFESLSFAELKAILEAEKFPYTITEKLDQTVRLEADEACVKHVQRRSGYTRVCALELFACNADDSAIAEATNATNFTNILAEGETFEVRIRRIKEYSTKSDTMRLEAKLGKLILQNAKHAKVNLSKPDKTFYGVLTNGKLVFGLKLAEIAPKPFVERRPRKKPFFHPSAMNAKLARCMVNLAHARENETLLDPFCGTGTTILEATLIGANAIGIDVQKRMANGTKRNLKHFGLTVHGILVADARRLPLTRVDCVVTDPPYGKSATTLKSTTHAIVEAVLTSAYALLGKGQRICVALPIMTNKSKRNRVEHLSKEIEGFVAAIGYQRLESHNVYVHRTLTREVVVYEKT
jgi:tRNA (guanine10-N2)-dimethyltransferase